MYLIIGTYLLVGVLINLLIDILFNHLEERQDSVIIEGDLEKFDNFTKFLVMLFWPIVIIYILLSILNEYTK
jgi:Na+/H+-dicarboxylate symporter